MNHEHGSCVLGDLRVIHAHISGAHLLLHLDSS